MRSENTAHDTLSLACAISPMKDVFQRGVDRLPGQFGIVAMGSDRGFQRRTIAAGNMQARSERRDAVDAGLFLKRGGKLHQALAGHAVGGEIGLFHDLTHSAVRQEFAIGDIRNLMASARPHPCSESKPVP